MNNSSGFRIYWYCIKYRGFVMYERNLMQVPVMFIEDLKRVDRNCLSKLDTPIILTQPGDDDPTSVIIPYKLYKRWVTLVGEKLNVN